MTRRGGLTRNRIFTDGLLSYIKRPGGAGGSLGSRSARRAGGAGRGDVKRKVPNYTYLYKSITLQNSRPGGTWTANC